MSTKDERVVNALRVLVGEPVLPVEPARWWHAYGAVVDWPLGHGEEPLRVHRLTLIGPAEGGPEQARALGGGGWGEYLTSWDHEPSTEEKETAIGVADHLQEGPW